jgi:N-acyl-phosphatidylethanolamine-hydrolysing phospholipase D
MRFRNPWAVNAQPRGFGAALRWLLIDRPRSAPRDAPTPTVFAATHPPATAAFASPHADDDALSITWIGHSSFLIQIGGRNILTDPMWGERASPLSWAGPKRWVAPGLNFASLPPIDAVLISHNHYDHLDRGTVERLTARDPAATWYCPLGVASWLAERGANPVVECEWWQHIEARPVGMTCVPAQHFSGRGITDRDRTLWCGWALRSQALAVYFVGDTGRHPLFGEITRRCGPFDVVLMPIGAYDPRWFMSPVHQDPEEAVSAFSDIVAASNGARPTMVAMHWGTFKLTDEPMDEPPKRAIRAWEAAKPAGELWIPRHGETRWFP